MAEPKLAPVDVHEALSRLELTLAGLVGAGIRLELALAAADPVVELDSGAFERAMINLAINARDALPSAGGCVRIATSDVEEDERSRTVVGIAFPGRYLSITVRDDEFVAAMKVFARAEGISPAPEGAATMVALQKLRDSGFLKTDDRVVLFNTSPASAC